MNMFYMRVLRLRNLRAADAPHPARGVGTRKMAIPAEGLMRIGERAPRKASNFSAPVVTYGIPSLSRSPLTTDHLGRIGGFEDRFDLGVVALLARDVAVGWQGVNEILSAHRTGGDARRRTPVVSGGDVVGALGVGSSTWRGDYAFSRLLSPSVTRNVVQSLS